MRLADSTSLEDFAIDPAELERLASPRHARGRRRSTTAAIPADMESMLAVAERRGWYVIEDAAHAPGARLGGAALRHDRRRRLLQLLPEQEHDHRRGRDGRPPRRERRRPGAQPALARDDDDDVGPAPRPRGELRRRRRRLQLPDRRDAGCARTRPALAARRAERRARAGDGLVSRAPRRRRRALAARSRRPRHARRTTSRRSSRPRSRLAIGCGSASASRESRRASTTRRSTASATTPPSAACRTPRRSPTATLTLPLHPGLTREDVETVCAALLDAS